MLSSLRPAQGGHICGCVRWAEGPHSWGTRGLGQSAVLILLCGLLGDPPRHRSCCSGLAFLLSPPLPALLTPKSAPRTPWPVFPEQEWPPGSLGTPGQASAASMALGDERLLMRGPCGPEGLAPE